jgi:bifunctional DNase/RNase
MTTVHIAHAEPRPHFSRVLVVLADETRRRAIPIWLPGIEGLLLAQLLEGGETGVPYELTDRLLRATGASVTRVDIEELGPEIPVARLELHGPAGTSRLPVRLAEGLALAVLQNAPIQVTDALMDSLAQPADAAYAAFAERKPMHAAPPRSREHHPRNLRFEDGLDAWDLRGSFLRDPTGAHWNDYECSATPDGSMVLHSAVPAPYGFADLRQAIRADDYRGRTVHFTGELRADELDGDRALYLRIVTEASARNSIDNRVLTSVNADAHGGWAGYEVTVAVPDDAVFVLFGVSLTGLGRIELRKPLLTLQM